MINFLCVSESVLIKSVLYAAFRGLLNTKDPQIITLMIGIWASLGLDFATFSIFYAFSWANYAFLCLFSIQVWGLQNVQYAPEWN